MRHGILMRSGLLSVVIFEVGAFSATQAQPPKGPCQQIRAACQGAGFAQGGAKAGNGLLVDCINPIMQGIAQRPKATKPLPQVDPQIVAACKARNPNFGLPKAKRSSSSKQPWAASLPAAVADHLG
jgi:hypothetical protein